MNKRKVLRVLREAGSLTHGALTKFRESPERCSIGCLLHAIGVSDEKMRQELDYSYYDQVLRDAYGVTPIQVQTIANFNDSASKSTFAKDCKFSTPNTSGAKARRNKARACIVIKEIQRMQT